MTMLRLPLTAVALLFAVSLPASGEGLFNQLQQPGEVAYSATPVGSLAAASAEVEFDEHFLPASLVSDSCGAEVGCCDCCGNGSNEGHDSCVDWVLPRSHLPLPLLKGMTEGRDVVLPLPLGTSFIWTELDRNVAVSDVRLAFGSDPLTSVDRISVPETTFHASTKIARVDLWVLPCVNFYGIIGHTKSTGSVAVTVDRFPLPASPPVTLDIPVSLEGPTAGFGMTSGIGAKDWFAMLDINKTWTSFSKLDSSLTALVVTPRVGLVVDRPCFQGEVHIGAMYQDTAQTVELTIDHPILGNGLHVAVDQFEPNPWNFLVGGLWALDERLQVLVEGGMGGRSYIVSGVTIRY